MEGKQEKIPSEFPLEIMVFFAAAKRGVGQGINLFFLLDCAIRSEKFLVAAMVLSVSSPDGPGVCPRLPPQLSRTFARDLYPSDSPLALRIRKGPGGCNPLSKNNS